MEVIKILKERNTLVILFTYLLAAFGVYEGIHGVFGVSKILTLAMIFLITGFPIVMIVTCCRGKREGQGVSVVEIILISITFFTGVGFAVRTIMAPTPLTVLMRMMEPQENWFIEKIIKEFEKENSCKVFIKRFNNDYELCEILISEAENKKLNNVSLVKTPLHLTSLLHNEGLVKPIDDVLSELGFSESEIESQLRKIEDAYDPVALKMARFRKSKFAYITENELYFLPRKLEARLMIYRKSKVADAVKNWERFYTSINNILRKENGYGLPLNYKLEQDVNEWDFYDLFVAGFYWANTKFDNNKIPRIAHRSQVYYGTIIGLIDRALQLGSLNEDIVDMYRFSNSIIDVFHWEAIFRKYNIYCNGMWKEDGWSGEHIYNGIKEESIYLTWGHQLDCLLIYGQEHLDITGYITNKEDLGISIMPQGVSFELTENGLPKRIGSRKAHTFGWFWGIPKNSQEPELAYNFAKFITSNAIHIKECTNFGIIPIKKDVIDAIKKYRNPGWQFEVFTKSLEQFEISGDYMVPRFKTLDEYQEFFDNYYDAFEQIVIKERYSRPGSEDRVDRDFIRENIK